jgi:hypothetical protein
MVEAAHQYRVAPRVTPAIQRRQEGQCKEVRAIALKAPQRLNSRYRILTARHKKPVIVTTALARELCGFVWAIACQLKAPEKLQRPPTAATTTSKTNHQRHGKPYQLRPAKVFQKD